MKASELKPCPFCGRDAEIKYIGRDIDNNSLFRASCLTSMCCGHYYGHGSGGFLDKSSAVKAWNRRKG